MNPTKNLASISERMYIPCVRCNCPHLEGMQCPRCAGRERSRLRRQSMRHRELAARYGVPSEPYRTVDVFERDGWICGICGLPVDKQLVFPDPKSAALDHKIPVSRGGPNLLSNVQCSHLSCNCSKRDALKEAK